MRPRQNAWPLGELIRAYRPALLVYAALRDLAGERRQYQCTRSTISEKIGLNVKTISKAMAVLQQADWIKLGYGTRPDQCRKWYRITFVSADFFPPSGSNARCRTSTPATTSTPAPETHGMGSMDGAVLEQNAPIPDAHHSAEAVPEDQETVPRERDHQLRLPTSASPEAHQTDRRDASLDPSNGSKGSVPLDPRGGSYSLERVGGAPPPAPPPLRCGGSAGTPQPEQGLKQQDEETLSFDHLFAQGDEEDNESKSFDRTSPEMQAQIEELIAWIGSEATTDQVASPEIASGGGA